MNKPRRQKLQLIIDKLEELKDELDGLTDEEQDAYDNLPEPIQMSDRGQAIDEGIDELRTALDAIDETIECIADAIEE